MFTEEKLQELKTIDQKKFTVKRIAVITVTKEVMTAVAYFKPLLQWILDIPDHTNLNDGDLFRALMEDKPPQVSMEKWMDEAETVLRRFKVVCEELGLAWEEVK